ncbi:MAG: hypothetical protein ABSC08_19040 [Bryobacteraceae bacterium]
MALRYAKEPTNGAALVKAGMDRIGARPSPLTGRGIDFAALQLKPPHAVYDLQADEVAAGKGLSAAHATCFRYMVHSAEGAIAAAEVHADKSGTATLLANVNYGQFVPATESALAKLEQHEAVQAADYEVRLLRCAALALMAMWLKPDGGGADIVYPLPPAPAGLEAEKAYNEADFLKAIKPLAEKRAASAGSGMVP